MTLNAPRLSGDVVLAEHRTVPHTNPIVRAVAGVSATLSENLGHVLDYGARLRLEVWDSRNDRMVVVDLPADQISEWKRVLAAAEAYVEQPIVVDPTWCVEHNTHRPCPGCD